MRTLLHALLHARRGATAIEYGLIVAMIALAAVGAIQLFADGAIGKWNFIQNSVAKSS
jgi:pilus assembly protein Flp/PilA